MKNRMENYELIAGIDNKSLNFITKSKMDKYIAILERNNIKYEVITHNK